MILDFTVGNYKSFQNETIFSLVAEASRLKSINVHRIENKIGEIIRTSKVSVVYGPNASGKSNLLSALTDFIFFIVNQPKIGIQPHIYNPFAMDLDFLHKPTSYKLNFLGPNNIRYEYYVLVDKLGIIEEKLSYFPAKRARKIFVRKSSSKKANVIDANAEMEEYIIDNRKFKVFSNQLLLSKFAEEPHSLLSDVYLYFRDKYNLEVCKSNYSDSLSENAKKMLFRNPKLKSNVTKLFFAADTKIIGFDIEEEVEDANKINYHNTDYENKFFMKNDKQLKLHFNHKLYSKGVKMENAMVGVPQDFESKGTQTLFTIGTNIFNALERGQVLIVDELDSSLHPYITKMLVQLFLSDEINKHGAQLIFNTHDVTLLDEELFRKDQIWLTEKNDKGITELFCLSDFEGLREDTPFEKWYMAGKFGGLPNIPNLEKIFTE